MKISIDKDKCIKCGLCASICPDVFSFGEDGMTVVCKDEVSVDGENGAKLADDLKMAEKNCPNGAIKLE